MEVVPRHLLGGEEQESGDSDPLGASGFTYTSPPDSHLSDLTLTSPPPTGLHHAVQGTDEVKDALKQQAEGKKQNDQAKATKAFQTIDQRVKAAFESNTEIIHVVLTLSENKSSGFIRASYYKDAGLQNKVEEDERIVELDIRNVSSSQSSAGH